MYSLVGDSNISRNIGRMSRRASSAIKNCQVIPCGVLEVFESSLDQVQIESNVCIVSCITNFIASVSGSETLSQRVDPVLQKVARILCEACVKAPSRSFMVSPPMYRTSPIWYRDGLPEILTLTSSIFMENKPKNLHLLPSFPTPEFDSDGVHLSPFSGLEFVVSLFDYSDELLDNLKKSASLRCDISAEQTRTLSDRMMVLEQDHRRLNQVVEKKSAVDAELADYRENERLEDSFVISGLPSLPSSLSGKDWQSKAVSCVQKFISDLMGRSMEIVVVQNATPRQKDSETVYNVRMASVDDSRAIRRKFGAFFRGSKDGRPDHFKNISVKNKVTPDTKIRISLLKLMAKRYKDSNPGSKVQVIGYEPRPVLKIIPPTGSSDRRTRVYNYIEACRSFPTTFNSADLDPVLRRIHPSLKGAVKSTFIVLSDDMLRPRMSGVFEQGQDSNQSGPSETSETEPAKRGTRRPAESPPGTPCAKR